VVTKTTGTIAALVERSGNSGFLRFAQNEYRSVETDPIVPSRMCRDFGLRGGELVEAVVEGTGPRNTGGYETAEIVSVDGLDSQERKALRRFEDRTVISPDRPLRLSKSGGPLAMRMIDLFTPIGFGQRGLIVAPPRTGKTILLQQLAHAIRDNHSDAVILILLIDERPEEVTDMKRNVPGEVVASSNDLDASNHVRMAELMIERARRLVETGKDVVVLADSLTRLGRAHNQEIRETGRVLSGGLVARALERPKAFFGAARNFEEGGSLTIIASALVDTGSQMDEVIFNEFKGTGNLEIVLSSELANHRVWPAIDLQQSGTRNEDLLLSEDEIAVGVRLRKKLQRSPLTKGMPKLLEAMRQYDSNDALVAALA